MMKMLSSQEKQASYELGQSDDARWIKFNLFKLGKQKWLLGAHLCSESCINVSQFLLKFPGIFSFDGDAQEALGANQSRMNAENITMINTHQLKPVNVKIKGNNQQRMDFKTDNGHPVVEN